MSDDSLQPEPLPRDDYTPAPEWQAEEEARLIQTARDLTAEFVYFEMCEDAELLRALNDIRIELNLYTCASQIRNELRKFDARQTGLNTFLTAVVEFCDHHGVELSEEYASRAYESEEAS